MLMTSKRSKYPVTVNTYGEERSDRASPLTIPPAVFPMETERGGVNLAVLAAEPTSLQQDKYHSTAVIAHSWRRSSNQALQD